MKEQAEKLVTALPKEESLDELLKQMKKLVDALRYNPARDGAAGVYRHSN